MQNTSWETLSWRKHKLESRLPGEISITSDMQIGESSGTPLQYSCLENPMDGGSWKAAVHGVAEGRTWLSDFTFNFHFPALEKEMATHSSVLAWRIPGTGGPGGLLSMGLHKVRHDWSDLAAAAMTKRRKKQMRGKVGNRETVPNKRELKAVMCP